MGPVPRCGLKDTGEVLSLGGREEAVRRHNREVLGHLRRHLAEEHLMAPMWPEYRLRAEEVLGEEHEGEETLVVRFRLTGDDRTFGFRIELSEVSFPSFEDPVSTHGTILALLDEAVLVGQRSTPDREGVVWIS